MNKPNHKNSDAELRRRCAMEAVIDTYQTSLLRYAAEMLDNAALAQDVVEGAFRKLFRQWQCNTRVDKRLQSWLFRVVHQDALARIRKVELRRKHSGGHVTFLMPAGSSRSVRVDRSAERVDTGALRDLPMAQHQVVLLRIQQGMNYKEISSVIGSSVGHVGDLLHTAVRKLSGQIRKVEGGTQ